MKKKISKEQVATHGQSPSFMYLTIDQLCELGVSKSTVIRKLNAGKWKVQEARQEENGRHTRKVLISSLPIELQLNWAKQVVLFENLDNVSSISNDASESIREIEKNLSIALLRIPSEERINWIIEALRLAKIALRYAGIKQKRQRDLETGKSGFISEVFDLCLEAVCKDPIILARQPHRASPPSPHTLDGWWRLYKNIGLLTFLRSCKSKSNEAKKTDNRFVELPPEAVEWIDSNWDKLSGPRALFNKYKELAKIKRWKTPSESWFYRLWDNVPAVVKVLRLEGRKAYGSKLAPYVPRDYSDLQALQVLSGDHSERDITVSLPDGTIRRPWLTIWYDLLTALIWGWHLSLVPSSYTAGLAYADGVQNFGAQPFSRPNDGFFSFILTDRGRDYRSHRWDGKIVTVHKEAMRPEGGLEALLVQQRIGIVEELSLKHLTTRGHNPKENPVERIHGIISEWEKNTFAAYCGRNPSSRPEQWHKLYLQQKLFEKGKRDSSPFPSIDQYREELAEFITRFNTTPHIRTPLGGIEVVPLEEFRRLYTTPYKIDLGVLAILLMKAVTKKIQRIGVQLFQKNWFYLHDDMLPFIGSSVEIRYADGDYKSVFVVLPNRQICEAERITPSSIINPNAQTQKAIVKARKHEKKINEEFHFIAQSQLRGETMEDRVAQELNDAEFITEKGESQGQTASVHLMTRMHGQKLRQVSGGHAITASDVANTEAEEPLIVLPISAHVTELDGDE
jgi:transposase InsO family protein